MTAGTHSLRENNKLLYILPLLLAVILFYFDSAVIVWMRNFRENSFMYPFLKPVESFVNFIGHGATLIISSFVLYVAGRVLNRRLQEIGRSLFLGFLSAGILVQILKHLIGRARPRITGDLLFIGPSFKSSYDSFPSGHTTLTFCLAYILSGYFPKYKFLFYAYAVIVGLFRIVGTSHFPSDVLAGAVVGTFAAKVLSEKLLSAENPNCVLSNKGF